MTDLDIERIELAVLDIKPGQVLVVKVYGNPSGKELDYLAKRLEDVLPNVLRLIVSERVEFSVIDAPVS